MFHVCVRNHQEETSQDDQDLQRRRTGLPDYTCKPSYTYNPITQLKPSAAAAKLGASRIWYSAPPLPHRHIHPSIAFYQATSTTT